jgi:hypothetical protein
MNETEVVELVKPNLEGCTVTEVKDFGDAYAIYFVNDEYYKSKQLEDLKIGAGPIIYVKNTGEVFRTGSGQSAEQYIRAYRECGDVYGRESETLAITGLPKELNENEAILNLKAILGLGLAESKAFVEQIAGKGKIEVALKNESEAEEAKIKLAQYGFKVRRLWKRTR